MDAGLTNGDGRPHNQPGWYRQKETGAEMYLENTTPEYGSPMIDAFVKGGWEPIDKPSLPPETEIGYTESVTKTGATQYRLNGKLISKEQYDSKQ